jgi:hypothetical protein
MAISKEKRRRQQKRRQREARRIEEEDEDRCMHNDLTEALRTKDKVRVMALVSAKPDLIWNWRGNEHGYVGENKPNLLHMIIGRIVEWTQHQQEVLLKHIHSVAKAALRDGWKSETLLLEMFTDEFCSSDESRNPSDTPLGFMVERAPVDLLKTAVNLFIITPRERSIRLSAFAFPGCDTGYGRREDIGKLLRYLTDNIYGWQLCDFFAQHTGGHTTIARDAYSGKLGEHGVDLLIRLMKREFRLRHLFCGQEDTMHKRLLRLTLDKSLGSTERKEESWEKWFAWHPEERKKAMETEKACVAQCFVAVQQHVQQQQHEEDSSADASDPPLVLLMLGVVFDHTELLEKR